MRTALSALLLALLASAGCKRSRPAPEGSGSASAPVATAGQAAPSPFEARPAAPSLSQAVAGARLLAFGDLVGDGREAIVVVDEHFLRVLDAAGSERARVAAEGGVQTLSTADVDGDGKDEILVGWGRTREHREAKARLTIHRLMGSEIRSEQVFEPETERHDVVAFARDPRGEGALFTAFFENKYEVRRGALRKAEEGWRFEPGESVRMAMSFALDPDAGLAVGRIYGDETGQPGEAYVIAEAGRLPVAIAGGVRSLAFSDLDGDGTPELLIGDGWDRDYGKVARALFTVARREGEGYRSEVVDRDPDQYTFWEIVTADLDGDETPEIVTRGNARVRLLRRHEGGYRATTVAADCQALAATKARSSVLMVCSGGAHWLGRPPL